MNSKIFAIFIILLLIFAAGCTVKVGPEAETDEVGEEAVGSGQEAVGSETPNSTLQTPNSEQTETTDCSALWLNYKQHVADGFSHTAAVALTDPCVNSYTPTAAELAQAEAGTTPPSSGSSSSSSAPLTESTTEFLEYLNANIYTTFSDLPERILLVKKSTDSATLTYSTSNRDPSQESVYLCGVLLMHYSDIDEVNVTGYNAENKEMEAAKKTFKRSKFNFNNYKTWFPDYVYDECEGDDDCADNNDCTKDLCKENKCYNSKIVNTGCPA